MPAPLLLGLVLLRAVAAAQSGCAPVAGASASFTFDEPMFHKPGARAPALITGVVGKALRFDGQGQYFEVPKGSPGLDVGEGNFTLELWIRTTGANGTVNVIDKRDAVPRGYLIFIHQGHPGFQLAYGVHGNLWAREMKVADGRWHHVAGVARRLPPDRMRLFVDGAGYASQENTRFGNLDVTAPLWLGRHHANGRVPREDIYFQGDIDELAIYRRALTPAEILSIYKAGSRGKCLPKK